MESLAELGARHGTDKAMPNRGLLAAYERHLAPFRFEPVLLLEIGVLGGGSLRMWRDYFPHGRVVGIDINPDAKQHEENGVRVFIGQQTDEVFLEGVIADVGQPHIVIDDGSHWARDQIGCLGLLWPHLRPGGWYIVEDVHTSYLELYQGAWRQPDTTIEYLKGVVDDVNSDWHDAPLALPGCEAVCFYRETCLLWKNDGTLTKRRPKATGPAVVNE